MFAGVCICVCVCFCIPRVPGPCRLNCYLFTHLSLFLYVFQYLKVLVLYTSYYYYTCRKLSLLLSYHKKYHVELSAFCNQIKNIRDAEALPQQHSPYFSPTPEQVNHSHGYRTKLGYTNLYQSTV